MYAGGKLPDFVYAVALGVVPSLVQLCLMHKLPESPRVLILRGQDDRAREVLKQIYRYASREVIELKLEIVRAHVQATTVLERSTTWAQRTKKLWCHKPYRRSILTVCMIQVFGQFTGYVVCFMHALRKKFHVDLFVSYNTLLYYAGTLFGLVGLSNASLGGLIPSITNTFFLVSLKWYDS